MSDAGSLPAAVRFADTVKLRLGEDRGFLFDQRTGRVYSLNASAAFAAERIRTVRDTAAVLDAVIEEFEVEAATARHDLATFVDQLVAEGLAIANG